MDKKKPASPEGDGFPSTVLRSFPLTQLLAQEVDTDQKQRQRTHRKHLGASRSVKEQQDNEREEAKQRQPRNSGPSRNAQRKSSLRFQRRVQADLRNDDHDPHDEQDHSNRIEQNLQNHGGQEPVEGDRDQGQHN